MNFDAKTVASTVQSNPISVVIKVDANKIRLYLEGDCKAINDYLAQQNYTNVTAKFAAVVEKRAEIRKEFEAGFQFQSELLHAMAGVVENNNLYIDVLTDLTKVYAKQEAELNKHQSPKGYSVAPYNFVYSANESSNLVEFLLPISEHFNDTTFPEFLGRLIQTLNLPECNEVVRPNMNVSSLQPRVYIPVLPKLNVAPRDALNLVKKLESEALAIAAEKQVRLGSTATLSVNTITQPTHVAKVGVFGVNVSSAVSGPVSRTSAPHSTSRPAPQYQSTQYTSTMR